MATKKNTTKKSANRYVVIATQSRPWSIVAGTLESETAASVRLTGARMIAYYSSDARTLFGVAAKGPGSGARVSPRVDAVTISPRPEHMIDATPESRNAIEAEPWH